MALPVPDNANDVELHDKGDVIGKATAEERASSGHESSSSSAAAAMSSSELEDAATPPPMQLMERPSSSSSSSSSESEGGGDPGRIPAAVFERDDDPSEPNKDWSMMSTESVFGLQVAPSSDFTGFFLAHPELMDIATPPRSSTVTTPPRTSSAVDADADVANKSPVSPPFDSIPELPEATMTGNYNYSFAFPNLIEDKRNISKKAQQEEQPMEAAAPPEPAEAAPAPAQAEAQAKRQASSKTEAAPVPEAGKGGLFSCFPCC
nr:unnamed protein product [Digitaria exilis]